MEADDQSLSAINSLKPGNCKSIYNILQELTMLIVWQWPDVKGGTPVVVRDRGRQVVKCPQHLVKRQAGHLVTEARVTLTGASIFETRVTSQGRYYKEHFLEDPFCTIDRIKKIQWPTVQWKAKDFNPVWLKGKPFWSGGNCPECTAVLSYLCFFSASVSSSLSTFGTPKR